MSNLVALVTQYNLLPWEDDDRWFEAELRKRGIKYEKPKWLDPNVDWKKYKLVIPRTTWDYSEKPQEFIKWVESVGKVTKMMNSP